LDGGWALNHTWNDAVLPSGTVTTSVLVTKFITSSLMIVTVALFGEPMLYAAFALSVNMTVSSGSTKLSFIGQTSISTDENPSEIVTLPRKAL
jgi:hypothetical protein